MLYRECLIADGIKEVSQLRCLLCEQFFRFRREWSNVQPARMPLDIRSCLRLLLYGELSPSSRPVLYRFNFWRWFFSLFTSAKVPQQLLKNEWLNSSVDIEEEGHLLHVVMIEMSSVPYSIALVLEVFVWHNALDLLVNVVGGCGEGLVMSEIRHCRICNTGVIAPANVSTMESM